MDDYNLPLLVFALLNLLAFLINYSYCDLVNAKHEDSEKTKREDSEKTKMRAYAISIFSQGFISIVIGSIILFGSFPLIGKYLFEFSKKIGFNKAISIEEAFIINFCVFFGFLGIMLMNNIIPWVWKAIREGYKFAKTDSAKE